MRRYRVRYAPAAEDDLERLYDFMLERDFSAAERALDAIRTGIEFLKLSPFSCRKAAHDTPLLRELIIAFGATGYVALFEIDDDSTVTVLAVRHQRESDYH